MAKIAMALLVIIASKAAFADDLRFYCRKAQNGSCPDRVVNLLKRMGCYMDSKNVKGFCEPYSNENGRTDFCYVEGIPNCAEPKAHFAGWTANATSCLKGTKKSLKKYDRNISLVWTMGLFRSYVKDLCVE